ncbi:MAG: hypothetical protein ACRDAO_07525 [Culicoidibacterales bacterium]
MKRDQKQSVMKLCVRISILFGCLICLFSAYYITDYYVSVLKENQVILEQQQQQLLKQIEKENQVINEWQHILKGDVQG